MRWLILLFIGLASLTQTSEARACSCMKQSPTEGLSSAYAVFSGTVTAVRPNESTKFGGVEVTLQVAKVWKGDLGQEVEVHTAGSSAACGYNFAEGETYLVYATRDEADPMRVSLCSRTAPEKNAEEDLAFLGKPANQFEDASTQNKSKRDTANTNDKCSASPGPSDGAGLAWAMLLLAGLAVAARRFPRLA